MINVNSPHESTTDAWNSFKIDGKLRHRAFCVNASVSKWNDPWKKSTRPLQLIRIWHFKIFQIVFQSVGKEYYSEEILFPASAVRDVLGIKKGKVKWNVRQLFFEL